VIERERVIAIVPARGGSKSIRNKNLRPLGGKPLLAWPIASAQQTPELDRIIVSTDDPRIAETARSLGAECYDRPAEYAGDEALVVDVIRHLYGVLRAEGETARIAVLLEATSPFRSPALISACLRRLVDEELDSIASFHPAAINPERVWRIENGTPRPFLDGAVPWRPRQLLTPAYQLNGAVYAFRLDRMPADGPGVLFGKMGAEIVRAEDVVDIDDERDLAIANALL
jgi:CMP-N,N'-diacetyllegionaminic acid synthase